MFFHAKIRSCFETLQDGLKKIICPHDHWLFSNPKVALIISKLGRNWPLIKKRHQVASWLMVGMQPLNDLSLALEKKQIDMVSTSEKNAMF